MARGQKNAAYAYLIPDTREQGIVDSWPACERKVKGIQNARYRGFPTRVEAEKWLAAGAGYEVKIRPNLEPGIYFDAGTGRGDGVEISVTDVRGVDLLHLVMPKTKINRHGKHLVPGGSTTNNYGELLACKYALKLALKNHEEKIFGDSKLIVEYWSKGYSNKEKLDAATVKLIGEVKKLRKEFEQSGGSIAHVSGDWNPADLGFH